MTFFNDDSVVTKTRLRDLYGREVVLLDEQEESVVYRIVEELQVGEQEYVVLQSDAERKEDEFSFYRLSWGQEQPELETIDDEDEWESVAEIYDELTFPDQD